MFLHIPGIKGESTDGKHKGEIALRSFSLSDGPSEASANHKKLASFTITKNVDRASPSLLRLSATDKQVPASTVAFSKKRKGKGNGRIYLSFRFKLVAVRAVTVTDPKPRTPIEQVTFEYHGLKEKFTGNRPTSITLRPSQLKRPAGLAP
jgi:type VI secretion system secreted protein Hcp